jgi:hypothetical protein
MRIEHIGPLPIYHVVIPNVNRLGMTFLRMQEFYESPKYKDRVFTVSEFARWYKRRHGAFTYASDYRAFNVPGNVVDVLCTKFTPLTCDESELVERLTTMRIRDRFYLIGTTGTNAQSLRHELAHALYFLVPEYRDKAERVLEDYALDPMIDFLSRRHYHHSVFRDEIQAYAMSEWPNCVPRTREMRAYRKKLKSVLSPYFQSILDREAA